MIHFIGDTHGKIKQLVPIVTSLSPAPTFQLGDMGLGFKGVSLPTQRETFQWIRGNHDDPARCYEHPNYMGDMGLMELEGRRMFWLAGAYSIDAQWRTPGVSWWPDEELSYEELDKAIALYEAEKPDLVISHECPQEVGYKMLAPLLGSAYFAAKQDCCNSRTSVALQRMFDVHQPRNWVFGHYHVNQSLEVKGTSFRCVAELSTYSLDSEVSHD